MNNVIFYTDRFIPVWAAGCARGPFIFIRPRYKDDAGLLAHERVHVKQWLRTFGLHGLLYLLSDKYKLGAEVQAYKAQAACYPDDRRPAFAKFISENYGLAITPAAALELLTKNEFL